MEEIKNERLFVIKESNLNNLLFAIKNLPHNIYWPLIKELEESFREVSPSEAPKLTANEGSD